jgi:hypothetical protein
MRRSGVRLPKAAPPVRGSFTLHKLRSTIARVLLRGLYRLYGAGVASPPTSRRRQRGTIAWLPSGSARVKVYAGIYRLTGKKLWLRATVAAVNELLDSWLEVIDVELKERTG